MTDKAAVPEEARKKATQILEFLQGLRSIDDQEKLECVALILMDLPRLTVKELHHLVTTPSAGPGPVEEKTIKGARAIADALKDRPGLRYYVTRELHMRGQMQILGPWEKTEDGGWVRKGTNGAIIGFVRPQEDGDWFVNVPGTQQSVDTEEEALRVADETMMLVGYEVLNSLPTKA